MLFTSDNDLPNSLVNDIQEDSYGIMWIATEDGLCRYNGSRFQTYNCNPSDPNSISSSFIRCVCTDKRGNVLVGSITGLQIYNRRKDNFSPIIKTEEIGLPTSNINDIYLLKNGDFIVFGVNCYTVHIDDEGNAKVLRNALSNCKLNGYHILEAPDGTLWADYGPQGIWHTDSKGKMHCIKDANGRNYDFSTICTDKDGRLFAGHVEGGIYTFNKNARRFDILPGSENLVKIRNIKTLPNSTLLCVATDGVGVHFFDYKLKRFVYSDRLDDPFLDIRTQKAHSLYINNAGDIWIALYQKGIFMSTQSVSTFGYIGNRSQQHNIIGNRCVTSIVERRDGSIWVATDNGGLYGITSTLEPIRHIPANDISGLPMSLMGLYEDSRQRLWFGSYNHGGGYVDTNTGACHYVPLASVNGNIFSIYDYAEDKRGKLWVASMGNGILTFDEERQQFVSYSNEGALTWTGVLFYDKERDIMYCGTYDGIVWFSLNDKTRKIHNIGPKYVIYSITRISKDMIGFGTTNGFLILNTKTNKIERVSTEQGLSSNNIFAVQMGKDGHVWLSSSSGLMRYDLAKKAVETYTVRDGLQGNEFYKNASVACRDGKLWFGGINGISYFTPGKINSRSSLKCTSRVVSIHAGERYMYADEDGCFVVPSGIETFNIELATLPLYMTHRVIYYYRLDNGNWEMLPVPQNRILFDNLGYGSHTLHTKAVIDGIESEETTTKLYVEYPWFLSWWHLLLWACILGGLAYFLHITIRRRRDMRMAIKQHQQEEEIKEAKLQFFMNIVHDLRTPLTLIATPLQKLKSLHDDSQHQRLYGIMDRNTDRLLRLTNEIMDLRKIDSGKMDLRCHYSLISRHINDTAGSMSDIMETRHQQLILTDRTNGNEYMWIDAPQFEKILVNLLSNAIKYTQEGGIIELEWGIEANMLQLCITDNGIGISDEDKQHIFDRFYQVRVNNKHIKGTGIGLNLVKALVELHHGTITVSDNPEGKGTRFCVAIPTSKEAYKPEEICEKETAHATKADNAETSDITENDSLSLPETYGDYSDSEDVNFNGEGVKGMTRKTILIVDDDDEIRNFLYEELSGPFNVIECADGKTAYDILVKGTAATSPYDRVKNRVDIVVSDVMMPEIDGIELTKMIRQNVRLSHLPVILLTAKASDRDRMEGLQATADAYVTKPFNLDLLQTIISNTLIRQEKLRNTFKGNELPIDQIDTPEIHSADDKLMERLLKVINDNLANPDLTSDILAKEVGLSRGHLYRKLKELTNQSATNYIRNIRLTKAAELLRQNKTTVSEVAYLVGFRTPNHFSTAFKELYGVTPSEYVKTI